MRILFFILLSLQLSAFDKVVIWGYELKPYPQESHTHAYIHYGFYRAFKALGYDVYWFKDEIPPDHFDFSNALFITEHHVKHIPANETSIYFSHMAIAEPLKALKSGKVVEFYVTRLYRDRYLENGYVEVEPFTYCNYKKPAISILWATDLLPYEIEGIKKKLTSQKRKKQVVYIGTLDQSGECKNDGVIGAFVENAKKEGFTFFHTHPSKKPISPEENCAVVYESLLAPAIQGKLQIEQGYLPCRIYKNISYGALGITNNPLVYELFGDRVVYNKDTGKLFYDAMKRLESWSIEDQKEVMDYVKENHTYINRIETILEFIDQAGL